MRRLWILRCWRNADDRSHWQEMFGLPRPWQEMILNHLNKEVQMSNDERIYWSAITISLFVVVWSFWVFSMEMMKWN